MRKFKKATAFLLALLLVFSTMMVGQDVEAADTTTETQEYQSLVLGEEQSVTFDSYESAAYFSFTPEEDDAYIFESLASGYNICPSATLYVKDQSGDMQQIAWEVYGGNYYNFRLTYQLEAGTTYYYMVEPYSYSGECSFNVVLSQTPVESVDIQPISVIQNTDGRLEYAGTEDEYYYYWWENRLNFTITMKDGQVITGVNTSGFNYNGYWYYFTTSDNQYIEHWTVGNTYTTSVSVLGYETKAEVSIVESPVQSITVEPISLIENCNGNLQYEETEDEFYYYSNWTYGMNFKVVMNDGRVITGTNANGFYYYDKWYSILGTDDQYNEHWTVGNTYTATVGVMGVDAEVEISIIESPVESIHVEPVLLIENCGGYSCNAGTEDEFYYYNWSFPYPNVTITMKDGQVIERNASLAPVDYNGRDYSFSYSDNQYSEHWEVGNANTGTISILGCETEVEVSIEESPVESIEVKPIVLTEGRDLYPGSSWRYNWLSKMECTVIMKDGSVIRPECDDFGYLEGITYKNTYYSWSSTDDQYQSSWYAGNTYTNTLSILGKCAEVPVSIYAMNQTDEFEYVVQDNNAIIVGCSKEDKVLEIPSVIDSYPVIGVTDLTHAMEYAEELVISDSVTMLSSSIFEWNYDLKKLTLGKGISNIYNEMFIGATCLEEIIVSEENPYYCSVDGAVYDKEMATLIVMPRAKEGTYTVPDTVTDIDCLIDNISYYNVQLDLGNSQTGYSVEDGIIYNTDRTVICACDKTKTGKYEMPNTVTTINEGAFKECSFSEVIVSENVSEIVYEAFSYSVKLEKVVLPEKLETIGWGAFYACEKLTKADLPTSLKRLGECAFAETAVASAVIPSTLKEVGWGAYKNSQLSELTILEGVEVISGEAFAGTQLKNVVIPDSITVMDYYAFADTSLESVSIGAGLKEISKYAFENTKLTTVTIPENIVEIGEYAFANSMLEEAIIEKEDIYIDIGAFYNCPLKELDLEDGVIAIRDYAFYGNQAESVVIPDSVTDVAYKSFAESKQLVNIDVPDDLESIDGTAFDGTAWWDAQADGVVYLENYLYGYKGNMPKDTEITVKDGTTLIASLAFLSEMNLKTLMLSSSVKNIGWQALSGCLSLEKVIVAEDNSNYFTNVDGTILYDQSCNSVWKKVENVLYIDVASSVCYGVSVDDWLYDWALWDNIHSMRVTYVDGQNGYESCAITADMVSGFDSTKPGSQTVTIDFGKFTCETEIYVEMPEMQSIKVSKLPNKTEYNINQSFRPAGMVVKGVAEDGTEFELEDYEIQGFESTEAGKKTITVSYEDLETTFEVEVIADRVTFVPDTSSGEETVQVSAPIEAMEEGATLKCDEKAIEDVKEANVTIPEIFEENSSQIYDIRFEKEENGEIVEVQPAEGTEVMVSIPIPVGMDGRNCKVYHITDGEAVDMKAVFNNGCMEFATTHFSYYGVVEVNGTSISGLVDYANVVDGSVTVTLSKGSELIDTVTAVDGSYNFTGLEEGTYIVKIEKTGHVAREYEVIVGGEAVEQDGQIRLIGDTNTDGTVDYGDIQRLYQHLSTDNKLVDYSLLIGDTNEDNGVDYGDIQRLYQHISTNNKLF